jgi:hypothetical protein
MRISVLVVLATILGGSVFAETRSTYVPPSAYLNFDCPQLISEARALSVRSATLAGVRPSASAADVSKTNGTVIPWPRAFSLVGDEKIADKLALMRGQMSAIEDASIRGQCSIQFQRPPA